MEYPTPILLPNSKWRHYRFRLADNSFKKVSKRIYKPEDLLAQIYKYKPVDVYQTVSYWLNPELLGAKRALKPGFRILQNFFLGSDYIMDFDISDYSSEQEMISNLEKAKSILIKEYNAEHYIILKTAHGFHLIWLDFDAYVKSKINSVMPMDREYAFQKKMKQLTEELMELGVKWDYKISIDTRRLIRVPNTLHRNGSLIKVLEWK